jgi:predicted RNase H-like HicB family nuclease
MTLKANKVFTIHISLRDDNSYSAYVAELKNCHAYADTLKELLTRLEKAIAYALELEDSKR